MCVYPKTYSLRESNSSEHVFILAVFPLNYIWLRNIDGTYMEVLVNTIYCEDSHFFLWVYFFEYYGRYFAYFLRRSWSQVEVSWLSSTLYLSWHLYVVDMMMWFGGIIIIQVNSNWAVTQSQSVTVRNVTCCIQFKYVFVLNAVASLLFIHSFTRGLVRKTLRHKWRIGHSISQSSWFMLFTY
jgi:hypothetical protein